MDQTVNRYLRDAIAVEKSLESQYRRFAADGAPQVSELFLVNADVAREQYELLNSRLQELGGTTSKWQSLVSQALGTIADRGQAQERATENLVIAFAFENAGVAMYEGLRIAAGMAGDAATASLVERIQTKDQESAEKIWKLIASTVERACGAKRERGENIGELVAGYLQDAEDSEHGLAEAFAGFGKAGEQNEVRTMMGAMSAKAKSQQERLLARLAELNSSASASERPLRQMLTFKPKSAQSGPDSEYSTQQLIIVYAAAAAQMALYEAVQTAARATGDGETLKLAQELQLEESEDHRLAWEKLPEAARTSSRAVLSTVS